MKIESLLHQPQRVFQECSRYPVATELFRLYRLAAARHARALPGTIARQDLGQSPELAPANGIGRYSAAGLVHPSLRWLADKSRGALRLFH